MCKILFPFKNASVNAASSVLLEYKKNANVFKKSKVFT